MAGKTADLDGALVLARSGDEAGFLELWRELQPRLLRYLRVLGCDDADDVASETWLQVVRDLDRFHGSADDFRRWLFTVGRHRAIDAARSLVRHRARMLPADTDFLVDGHLVEDQVLDRLSVQDAIRLLARLPPEQADAVALRVIAGLDTAAVAGILGKSPGAVRVALHRGLRTLAAAPALRALAATPALHALGSTGPRRALTEPALKEVDLREPTYPAILTSAIPGSTTSSARSRPPRCRTSWAARTRRWRCSARAGARPAGAGHAGRGRAR
jgi:RNA polymerase sigma-70 factor, ECF subfamily